MALMNKLRRLLTRRHEYRIAVLAARDEDCSSFFTVMSGVLDRDASVSSRDANQRPRMTRPTWDASVPNLAPDEQLNLPWREQQWGIRATIKSMTFQRFEFAPQAMAASLKIPSNVTLPMLERGRPDALSVITGSQLAATTAPYLQDFSEQALEAQMRAKASPAEADGIIIMLPEMPLANWTPEAAATDPMSCGEATAARFSLWLFLLLIELERQRTIASRELPVAFVLGGRDAHERERAKVAFERELGLFAMLLGDAECFNLTNRAGDNVKLLQHFADRLFLPTDAGAGAGSGKSPVLARDAAPRRSLLASKYALPIAVISALTIFGAGYYKLAGSAFFARGPVPRETPVATATAPVAKTTPANRVESPPPVTDAVRRERLRKQLDDCKSPSANCSFDEVARIASELRRLRGRRG